MAGKPAFDKSMAGKFWFGRSVFGGVGKEKKLGSVENGSCPHYSSHYSLFYVENGSCPIILHFRWRPDACLETGVC
jgi:hypothetical protein